MFWNFMREQRKWKGETVKKIFQQKFQDTPRKQPRTNSLYEDNQGKTARHTAGREVAHTEQKPEQL